MSRNAEFLPIAPTGPEDRFDIVLVTGDAYVDHPSFGAALVGRYLASLGYRVGILAQPDWKSADDFRRFGPPRLFFGVTAGNLDSMVANYTPDRRRRDADAYAPGGKAGLRPDHATVVYAQRCREAYPEVPVVLGGIEASLRRFAHYDFVQQKVRGSVLADAKADLLVYGMGERALARVAADLALGLRPTALRGIPGTAHLAEEAPEGAALLPSAEDAAADRDAFLEAARLLLSAAADPAPPVVAQPHGARWVVAMPPAEPLSPDELDALYHLPFARAAHPVYDAQGGVPALETVRFSIATHRGCYGGCSFCALTAHQGKAIVSRPAEGVVREVKKLAARPDFKGTIQDVGGPTANMYGTFCKKAGPGRSGCARKSCLVPEPCIHLDASGAEYLNLLRAVRRVPGVKHVFVASGVRHDLVTLPAQRRLFRELVQFHVGGQMKIAPEHVASRPLRLMGKPPHKEYLEFRGRFDALREEVEKNVHVVPYLMVGHPGTNLEDALDLARFAKRLGHYPEQVQTFTPTPMTASTCMYWTRRDPATGESVFVPSASEAAIQRALAQYRDPRNRVRLIQYFRNLGRESALRELFGDRVDLPGDAGKPEARKGPRGGGKSFAGGSGGAGRGDKPRGGGKSFAAGSGGAKRGDKPRAGGGEKPRARGGPRAKGGGKA